MKSCNALGKSFPNLCEVPTYTVLFPVACFAAWEGSDYKADSTWLIIWAKQAPARRKAKQVPARKKAKQAPSIEEKQAPARRKALLNTLYLSSCRRSIKS